ncbi:MAG: adenylosuccinate lyase, partial [Firmicutes bacterium]|nr:adenylosuccinate lyase [Bacillota bacterium]
MDTYQNPLISRYSTSEMAELFSDTYKVGLWRRLWVALAESQKELGLAITSEQIEEMKRFEKDINFDIA